MRGFTLVEIIVVIAIMAIIAIFATFGFRNFAEYQEFKYTVAEVVSLIEEARIESRSAIESEPHGIYIQSGSLTIFTGDSYDSMDIRNKVTSFTNARLEHKFSDTSDSIVFSQLNSVPSATGTIKVIGERISATSTFSITAAGVVQ